MRRVFLHCNRILRSVLRKWRNLVAMFSGAAVAPFETTPHLARRPPVYKAKRRGWKIRRRPVALGPALRSRIILVQIWAIGRRKDHILKGARLQFTDQITPLMSQKLCGQTHLKRLHDAIWNLFIGGVR
jgi:hypothetical protein